MKLIQQVKLFFQEGTSDKVYEIDLCEVGTDQYVVNFRYGKRGSNLKDGTKTTTSVNLAKAQSVFNSLQKEKTDKGYQIATDDSQTTVILPKPTKSLTNTLEGSILQRLQDTIDGKNTFKTVWKISRVAWRVGTMKFQEAVPYLLKLVDKGDKMQKYCVLWALARCADAKALSTFQTNYANNSNDDNARKIALEGLLRVSSGAEKQKLVNTLIERLPQAMQECFAGNQVADIESIVLSRIAEKQTEYSFLETLYLLANEHSILSKILAKALQVMPIRPPHFKHIRSIYKLAELRDDVLILGTLSYLFESKPYMYQGVKKSWRTSKYVPELGTYIKVKDEIKSKNSKIAFSDATKAYLQRRDLKRLKLAGNQTAQEYVKLATAILLSYTKEDYTEAYMESQGYGRWNYQTRKYTHTFVERPESANKLLLNLILNGNNKTMRFVENKWQKGEPIVEVSSSWYGSTKKIENPTTPIKRVKELNTTPERVDLYPEKWDEFPQAYIQLLMQGRNDLVHEFAYKSLKFHPKSKELIAKIDKSMIKSLVTSNHAIPVFFGSEIIKERMAGGIDNELIMFMLNSPVYEAREFAITVINLQPNHFLEDTSFITSILFSSYKEVRTWSETFLEKNTLQAEKWQLVVGKSVAKMLGETLDSKALAYAHFALKKYAGLALEKLSWNVVLELLDSVVSENKVFASDILLLKSNSIKAEDIPFKIVSGFLGAESEQMRNNGMAIFAKYSDQNLLKAHEMLGQMVLSPHTSLRDSAIGIVKKLIPQSTDFSRQICTSLLTALRRKETYENSHESVAKLLLNDLESYLKDVELKEVLDLIYGNYRQGQLVGFHILGKYIDTASLTLRQVIALANHELLAIRHWAIDFFEKNVSRIRYERNEAIRLLDAKWDDTRLAAMNFFRTHFTKDDWDVDSLVSIADSVRSDVENFGKELIMTFFEEEDGEQYLTMLSQHPSASMQLFVTNYLERFASNHLERLKSLEFFFRSALMRVNQGRIAKDRIVDFLEKEATNSEETAFWLVALLNDMVNTLAIQDKARFIQLLQRLKHLHKNLKVAITFEPLAVEE
ncbi:MAG: WGR domain-containing protein [Raineya sp.]|jgi:predicted DNA-binding WGR domain protein|nr:WGR domain-containing protein [Raineya sp.]